MGSRGAEAGVTGMVGPQGQGAQQPQRSAQHQAHTAARATEGPQRQDGRPGGRLARVIGRGRGRGGALSAQRTQREAHVAIVAHRAALINPDDRGD